MFLMKYRIHPQPTGDLSDFTTFELLLELERQGWTMQTQNPSKRMPPYKDRESAKVWFYKTTITKPYLQTLLQASTLATRGVVEIYHWQANMYYKALMSLPPSLLVKVQPWQPYAFYKVLLQQAKKGTHFGFGSGATSEDEPVQGIGDPN